MTPRHTHNHPGAPKAPDVDLSKLQVLKDVGLDPPLTHELKINDALPGLVRGQETALLIDANNLFRRAKSEGFAISYAKLKTIFEKRCDLRHAAIFTAIEPEDPDVYKWMNAVTGQGYDLITKPLVRRKLDDDITETKGNMDVEITMMAMELASSCAHIVIATSDGDFIPLVERLRKVYHRKVSVMGVGNHHTRGMNQAIIGVADNFYDLYGIKDYVSVSKGRP